MKDPVLRTITSIMFPFVLLFGLYVQIHGDQGPGGGFQAGVIMSSAFILYSIVFNVNISDKILYLLAPAGVFIYGATGFAPMFICLSRSIDWLSFLINGEGSCFFLQHAAFSEQPSHGEHIGITMVELGVGITVCSVMLIIYSVFSDKDGYT